MYFTEEFNSFFKELAANNHRDWFQANKKRYIQHVKDPFYALVADIVERIKKHDTSFDLLVKDAVFRINRDIRFSKDKSPYKLHVSAVIVSGGRKNMQLPGMYLQAGVEDLAIGGGMYMPDKEGLTKIRSAIMKQPNKLPKLLNDKKFKGLFGGLVEGEKNKILPKEFKEAGAENPMLFNKQFFFMKHYEDSKTLLRPDLDAFFEEHYIAAKPINDFLYSAVK